MSAESRLGESPAPLVRPLAWAALAVAAALLRLPGLFDQIPVGDEWHALYRVATADSRSILTTIGDRDVCPPWALLLEAISRVRPIDEVILYVPIGLLGFAACFVPARSLGVRIAPSARWFLSWLTVTSPILVYFARTARPYVWAAPAAFMSVVYLWRWSRNERRVHAVLYVASCTVAIWSLPVYAPFCAIPAAALLVLPRRSAGRPRRRSILALACAANVPAALLLLPGLLVDSQSLIARVAKGTISGDGISRASWMLLGSRGWWLGFPLLGLASLGAWLGLRRGPRRLVLLLVAGSLAQVATVFSIRPWMIEHPLVLARYSLPVLLSLFYLAARGAQGACQRAPHPARRSVLVALALVVVIPVFLDRSLTVVVPARGNFAQSLLGFRLHYRARFLDETVEKRPEFYHWLSSHRPTLLIEAPFAPELRNGFGQFQLAHGIPVSAGVVGESCGPTFDRRLAELSEPAVRMRSLIAIDRLDPRSLPSGTLLALHRNPSAELPRPPPESLAGFAYEACRDELTRRFGPPVWTDETIAAFAIH